MKKTLTILAVALVMFASACKKEETSTPAAAVKGTWTLGGTAHKVAFSTKTTTSGGSPSTLIIFMDAVPNGSNTSSLNTFNLSFKTAPTATGTYELVSASTSTLTANQFQIFAGGPAGVYVYTGAPVSMTLNMVGGKLQFTLPEISVTGTTSAPAVKLSASVQEM